MLKRLTFGASIAALALGLAASAAPAADKPVYGVLMKTLSNPFELLRRRSNWALAWNWSELRVRCSETRTASGRSF